MNRHFNTSSGAGLVRAAAITGFTETDKRTQWIQMIAWAFAVVLLLFSPGVLFGQATLTLEEAVNKSLAGNREVLAAGHEQRAAGYGKLEAFGQYVPHLSIQEIYLRSNNPVMAFGTALNQGTFDFGTFDFGDPNQGIPPEISLTDFNEPEVVQDYITRLSVEQPIFAGGRIITGIYQASKMKQAAGLGYEHTRKSTEFQVAKAYYDVLRMQQFSELTIQVVQTVERHVKTAKDYYDTGFALESDLLQAKVFLAKAKVAAVGAENGQKLTMAMLNYLMGEDQSYQWTLSEPVSLDCQAPPMEQLISLAKADRLDLQAMTRKVEVARSQKTMAALGFVPTLGLKADYDFHEEDHPFGNQEEDWTFYAVAKWDVLKGLTDVARTGRSAYEAKAAMARLSMMKEGIELEVRQKALTLESEGKKLQMATAAVDMARRNLEILSHRFEKGLVKISELLDAQTAETEAKTNMLNATYDLILARLSLRHAIGQRQCGPDILLGAE